jgi:hypothetical protein
MAVLEKVSTSILKLRVQHTNIHIVSFCKFIHTDLELFDRGIECIDGSPEGLISDMHMYTYLYLYIDIHRHQQGEDGLTKR